MIDLIQMDNMETFVIRHPFEVYVEVDWICGFEGLVAVSNHGNIVRIKTGEVVVLKADNGYIRIHLKKGGKRKAVRVHRLVAHAFIWNPDPTTKGQVDHIDNGTTNNAVWNLRWVTNGENQRNVPKTPGKTSQFIGVRWNARANKWIAEARVDYKSYHIGSYDIEEDAARARDDWVMKHGSGCWKYNFP